MASDAVTVTEYLGPRTIYRALRADGEGRLWAGVFTTLLFVATGGVEATAEFEPHDHHLIAEGHPGAWQRYV